MLMVINGKVNAIGCPHDMALDFLCVADTLNEIKKENPDRYNGMIQACKEMSEDEELPVYESIKTLLLNLQDLF